MAKTPWKLAAVGLTLALGLAGCGDTEDEAGAPEVEETEIPAGETLEDTMPDDTEAATEEAPVTEEEATPEDAAPIEPGDDIEADAETLGESPAATLDEGGALPGEPTSSDIDAILEDTERRFEEAQRRIDEQYEEVERDSPALEPMEESTDFRSTIEPMQDDDTGDSPSAIDEEAERRGETTQSDIDAMLEETERRFEEARRQLDEQFEEAERRDPQSEAPQFDIED
ncbi:hypothetical protein [Halomonas chromatireducens]|uniref:Uncharacterized protein n=1 Tax=Halomonas chromatireducens TaxID=507626 RepID=A0A0X8HC61_9GAMM|nr:hypothetical protein [Halomonas chromatireducens]AMC99939.1 hypothetical protein LOKO_00858 [Halomonas chromatireducens]